MSLRLPTGIEKIDRVMEGYQTYQTLTAALDLGLFDFLDREGPSDREKIAQGIGINVMFSGCFLNTLVDIGILSIQDEKYANTPAVSDFLIGSSPFYQGDWIRYTSNGTYWWNNLVSSLKCQQPEIADFKAWPSESLIDSIAQETLRGEMQTVTKTISRWDGFSKARSLLDLGGGHGLYAIALCQINPRLGGVVFDKPHVIDRTSHYIKRYRMEEHLSTKGGDICTDHLGSGYDIVIMSQVLYQLRRDIELVFDKVYDCLYPGGLLVTNHLFSSGYITEGGGVSELAKNIQRFRHPLCDIEDFEKLLKKKGFKVIMTSDIPCVYDNSRLHLAVKE